YIDVFLNNHRTAVHGRVLEIGDRNYTTCYSEGRVVQSDVLHATGGNPEATLIGDLSTGIGIPNDAFDCMILTQTLPFIYDISGAIGNFSAPRRGSARYCSRDQPDQPIRYGATIGASRMPLCGTYSRRSLGEKI